MTGEEMERAIEFLLKNQADFDVKLVELKQQVAETGKLIQMHVETQAELIQVVTRNVEGQQQFNEGQQQFNTEMRATVRQLAAAQARTDEQLKRTDENLNRLAATVEQFIKGRS